jgi:transposase
MNSSHPIRRIRRQHTPEFKQKLVALCQPGASVSAAALAHGINANLLRRWIKQFSEVQSSHATAIATTTTTMTPAKLVPIQVESPIAAQANDAIEINIQRRSTQINIRWPGNQAHAFGQWLGEWLK